MKYDKGIYIIEDLPSLLGQYPFPYFKSGWSQRMELPPLRGKPQNQESGFFCLKQTLLFRKKQETQLISQNQVNDTNCSHTAKRQPLQQICTICYYQNQRGNKVAQCGHSDRLAYAKKMCYSCYTFGYKLLNRRKQIGKQ